CTAPVTVTAPAFSDDRAAGSLHDARPICTSDASGVYPLGTTAVTWTATDGSGNTATCSQSITVTDNINPSITCAANQSQNVDARSDAPTSALQSRAHPVSCAALLTLVNSF